MNSVGLPVLLLLLATIRMTGRGGEAVDVPAVHVPRASEAPVVDGIPDEPAWNHAAVIGELTPPRAADPAWPLAPPTSVRLLWDDDHLYLALIARDPDIHNTGTLKRDDPLYTEDAFEIFLDPVGDGRMMIETQINPANEIFDNRILLTAVAVSDTNGVLDLAMRKRDRWDGPEWNWSSLSHATAQLVEDGHVVGWTAEIAFPARPLLRRLGLRRFEPLSLKANVIRLDWVEREGEDKRFMVQSNWSPVLRGHAHISPAAMGTLILDAPPVESP